MLAHDSPKRCARPAANRLDRDPPVDWKTVLADLQHAGWTLSYLAMVINVPPSTLKGWWYDGSEPLFEAGRALLKLHGLRGTNVGRSPAQRLAHSGQRRSGFPLSAGGVRR